ncbi:putative reverse transcriptase domain-containing protein [Tanacetum coccineum]
MVHIISSVIAAPVISISSDTSEESVVALEVGAVSIISPTGVLDLVDCSSSSDSDPLEDSLPHVPELPLVAPFLCSDDSEAEDESDPAEQRPERHESLAAHDATFPPAPIVTPPKIHQRPTILIRPGEVIPFGRPYYTHMNGPRLSSSSSSSDSSSNTSSGPLSDSLPGPSSVHSSGCDSSESSLGSSSERSLDSSLPSARPSRKRCRSPTTSVPSSTHVSRGKEHMEVGTADAETVADLGISDRVGAPTKDGLGMGVEIAASDVREDEDEFEAKASEASTREIAIDPLASRDISESTRGDVPDHDIADKAVDITYETLGDLVQRFHDHATDFVHLTYELIVIHVAKAKKGLRKALTEGKGKRLSLYEQPLQKVASQYGTPSFRFTQKNILWVLPKGTQITFMNSRPLMVLRLLRLICRMFRSNGGCGYVKKPDSLMRTSPNGEVFDLKAMIHVKKSLKNWDEKEINLNWYEKKEINLKMDNFGMIELLRSENESIKMCLLAWLVW